MPALEEQGFEGIQGYCRADYELWRHTKLHTSDSRRVLLGRDTSVALRKIL